MHRGGHRGTGGDSAGTKKVTSAIIITAMNRVLFLLFFFLSINSFSQKKVENVIQKNSLLNKHDKEFLIKDSLDSKYIEILEKVNSQISLASNPFSYFITVIGLLFAILTIIATGIIYFQSQDFKKQRKKVFDEVNQKFENEIKLMNKSFNEKQRDFEDLNSNFLNTFKVNFEKYYPPLNKMT
ncbi:MAG: hypothetical protein IPH28_21725 [Cytophagaceae bacterium]|nr:hypothetical protein [Cytophagaceae bacterium]